MLQDSPFQLVSQKPQNSFLINSWYHTNHISRHGCSYN